MKQKEENILYVSKTNRQVFFFSMTWAGLEYLQKSENIDFLKERQNMLESMNWYCLCYGANES